MRCRKELKPAVQSLTDVEAARAAVFDAQQKYFAAGTNVDHAFKEYVAKCFPYVARIPEIYDDLALAAVFDAQQRDLAAGTNVDHAFKEYVAKCFPYVARIPEIYDHLVLSDVTEVMGALEQIVGTVIRYEPAAQAGSHAAQS